MVRQAQKPGLILIAAALSLSLGACATQPEQRVSIAPPPPAPSVSYLAVRNSAAAQPIYAETTAENLNAVETAAGAAMGPGVMRAETMGPVMDETAVAALAGGCDYSDRFEEDDRLGYRWGEGNRVGLQFGGGVQFGYRMSFDTPKKPAQGC